MALTVTQLGLLAARCVLALTFLVAGLAKLTNREASLQALREFGAPRLVQPLMPLLPWAELAVAVGLLFAASTLQAAQASLALLVIFITGISANLARGRQPPCNCFGQLHARPISSRTLVRNGVLAACATWLIVSGPPPAAADLWGALRRLDSHGRNVAIVVAAAIVVAILIAVRQEEEQAEEEQREPEPLFVDEPVLPAPPYRRAPAARPVVARPATDAAPATTLTGLGLAIDTSAPGFSLPDLEGHQHSLDSLRAPGMPVLLLFSSPHCQACQRLVPKLPGLAALHARGPRVVLITRGSMEQNRQKLTDMGTLLVLLQQDDAVSEAYNCTTIPAAVVVGADGMIQSRLAVGPLAIEQLLSQE